MIKTTFSCHACQLNLWTDWNKPEVPLDSADRIISAKNVRCKKLSSGGNLLWVKCRRDWRINSCWIRPCNCLCTPGNCLLLCRSFTTQLCTLLIADFWPWPQVRSCVKCRLGRNKKELGATCAQVSVVACRNIQCPFTLLIQGPTVDPTLQFLNRDKEPAWSVTFVRIRSQELCPSCVCTIGNLGILFEGIVVEERELVEHLDRLRQNIV